MYLLKNALKSIIRNKGRNILIGLIIVVISCATSITLAIHNSANTIVTTYKESNDIIGSITFDRKSLTENFKPGESNQKVNIEKFNEIEAISLDQIKNYGESDCLKGYYYLYETSLNSNTLTKATDTYEYEVTDKKVTQSGGTESEKGRFPGESPRRETITITKRTEKFSSSRNLTGTFKLSGYSSFDGMIEFINGEYKITDGEMITSLTEFECVINEELATLNNVKVGDTIKLKNTSKKKTYEFTVKGIYSDSKEDSIEKMYSSSANTIITGYGVIEKLLEDDKTLVTNLTPSFIIKDEESITKFAEELKTKELNEYYTLTTNLSEIEEATKSIDNVSSFAFTFLIVTLVIALVVLFTINMINIRERKYEIGVFRTIGLSKFKLMIQFILELVFVTIISLFIGLGIGVVSSKPIGNKLLQKELNNTINQSQRIDNNFGRPDMQFNFNKGANIKQIDSINAIVDFKVLLELLGIGIGLTLISSASSIISISRFSPLTILKERS